MSLLKSCLIAVLISCTASLEYDERCNKECPLDFQPIIDSDGQLFWNSCWLTYSQCVKGQVLVERELAGPGCPAFCSMVFAPVTGPDGKEYSNLCMMKQALCKVRKTQAPKKECPSGCFDVWDPVCGSDGKTYSNLCEIAIATCNAENHGLAKITEIYRGECKEGRIAKRSSARCGSFCFDVWAPVCGSDGKTYGNKCEMDSASCESEQNAGGKITLAHMGLCESKRDLIQCPDACMALWAPICGSDGKTYPNQCELATANCHAKNAGKTEITMTMFGQC